jgi:hypothetical protein
MPGTFLGQTQHGRLIAQQANDLASRHMAFNGVAIDQARVARAELGRYAQAGAGGGVATVVNAHSKAMSLQMNHPVFAAPAVRVFPDLDLRLAALGHGRPLGQGGG